jgi:hypothetical protein
LTQFLDKEIAIIEDPVEIETIPPKKPILQNQISLLWFGHETNIPYLIKYLHNHLLCNTEIRLNVLSNSRGIDFFSSQIKTFRDAIELNLSEWTLQNMISTAKHSDACLIPSDLNDIKKIGVSSNRSITAFALGLPVTADELNLYAPFSEYFHNIRNEPLSVFIKQLNLYTRKCEIAQENIVPQFREEIIAEKWNIFFNKLRIH